MGKNRRWYYHSKLQVLSTNWGGKSMNNPSQIRGSEGISSMTNYTYSDTFYKEIVEDDYHSKWHSFPQVRRNSCGKSVN